MPFGTNPNKNRPLEYSRIPTNMLRRFLQCIEENQMCFFLIKNINENLENAQMLNKLNKFIKAKFYNTQ